MGAFYSGSQPLCMMFQDGIMMVTENEEKGFR